MENWEIRHLLLKSERETDDGFENGSAASDIINSIHLQHITGAEKLHR